MLFMTKSALCIGIVSVLALQVAGGGTRDTLKDDAREAVAGLGRACAASADCVGLGARIASAATGQPRAVTGGGVEASLAAASDTLAVPPAPAPSAPVADAGRPTRHVRRAAASRD